MSPRRRRELDAADRTPKVARLSGDLKTAADDLQRAAAELRATLEDVRREVRAVDAGQQ